MEPISAGVVFSFINSAFKISEFAVRLNEVGSENEVFVRMIETVRRDLVETQRLLNLQSVQQRLSAMPEKLRWINDAIRSAMSALNEIGKWVERARVDQEALGSVRFENRVRWVFNDHEKLQTRRLELSACHQQLSTVLNYLVPMEEAPPPSIVEPDPPDYYEATRFDDFLAPRQRRFRRSTSDGPNVRGAEKARELLQSMDRANMEPLEVHASLLMGVRARSFQGDLKSPVSGFPREQKSDLRSVSLSPQHIHPGGLSSPSEATTKEKSGKGGFTLSIGTEPVELEASHPVLSGNSAGPVNPFELYAADPKSTKFLGRDTSRLLRPARSVGHLGTTSQRAELPGENMSSTSRSITPDQPKDDLGGRPGQTSQLNATALSRMRSQRAMLEMLSNINSS